MHFRIYTRGGIILGLLVLGSLIMSLSFHLQVIQKGNNKGERHILHYVKAGVELQNISYQELTMLHSSSSKREASFVSDLRD